MVWLAPVGGTVHEFVFRTPQAVHQVDLAGTFNNWNQSATPMQLEPDGRTWSIRLKLPYGRIQYKFVVDSQWTLDPGAPAVSDGNGHTNSAITILPPDYDRPASPNDGIIAVSALRHEPAEPDLNYDRGQLRFQFRARPDDLASVTLLVNGKRLPMTEASRDDLYETYQAFVPWDRKTDLSYDFELRDGDRTIVYGPEGLEASRQPGDATNARPLPSEGGVGERSEPGEGDPAAGAKEPTFRLIAKTYHPFEVPSWVENSVIYQIFPDRFADGDKSNDPADVQPWGGKPSYSNFFGGDAAGVKQHLDYLAGLGVKAVYFNPLFKSPSNHRYETDDYLQIDPRFGTNKEFGDLTRAMQAKGIRTVMDFAFNHTSTNFFAFKDIRDKGQGSSYRDWYFIKSYPVTVKQDPPYVAWFNYPSMPKLNVMDPEANAYVLSAVDFWEKNAALSGVRLDVANEVDPQMWRDLRNHVKAYAPDTWIVGEEWGDAGPWLGGDQWDATMGYQFRDACLHFFAEGSTSPSHFLNGLMSVYDSYAPQVSRNLMNLLGSHDTPRFLTLCHDNRDLLLLAATVQFTWPGAPTIYYGDELGMTGGKDPDNRRCMDWVRATADNPVLGYYTKLVHLRNSVPALRSGDPAVLFTHDADRTFAYSRTLGDQCAVVAVNASDQSRRIELVLPDPLSPRGKGQGEGSHPTRRGGLYAGPQGSSYAGVPSPQPPPRCTGGGVSDFQLTDLISGRRLAVHGRSVSFDLPPLKAAVLVSAEDISSAPQQPSALAGPSAPKRLSAKVGNISTSTPVGTVRADRSITFGHSSPFHSQGANP